MSEPGLTPNELKKFMKDLVKPRVYQPMPVLLSQSLYDQVAKQWPGIVNDPGYAAIPSEDSYGY